MKQYWIMLVAGLLALACGAPMEGEEFDGLELEQLDQAIGSKNSYGFAITNQARACGTATGSPSNQQCAYPPGNRTISFRCLGWGSDQSLCTQLLDDKVNALNNQFPAWEFGRLDSSSATVTIRKAAVSGASTTSILAYVQALPTIGAALTESTPYPGVYRHYSKMTVNVDHAKMVSTFVDPFRPMAHGIGAAMNIAIGAGFTTAHTNRHNSIAITLGAPKLGSLSTADACRVNGYDPSAGSLTINGAC